MRIYLDNAATSWPKPPAVYNAVDNHQRHIGVAVGRGNYRAADRLTKSIAACRQRAGRLFEAFRPHDIIFTFNGTDSLNLAIHGLLNPGDHVVTTTLEHNSVLRPLRELQQRIGIKITQLEPQSDFCIDPADVRDAIRPNTRLVAIIHASNVTGAIQPVEQIVAVAKDAGVRTLIDAAQTAGHLAIDVRELPVDLLACSGHKGLLGPLGTGLLYISQDLQQELRTLRQGGTGSNSEDENQPQFIPDKFESGNLNAPGLLGLEEGLAWIEDRTLTSIRKHEIELTSRFLDGLQQLPGVTIHGPLDPTQRTGIVSITTDRGLDPQVLSSVLDENFEIEARAGLHCAPGAHRGLGTLSTGGTLRFSPGPFNTQTDIEATLTALGEILSE